MGSQAYIQMSNPNGSYFPGEIVAGKVYLELSDDLNIKGRLRLELLGICRILWSERLHAGMTPPNNQIGPQQSSNHAKAYQEKEEYAYHLVEKEYFRYKIDLVETLGGNTVKLPSGKHEFPFSFALPIKGIPSSFSGRHGSTVYKAVVILKEWLENKTVATNYFTVNGILDLNNIRNMPGFDIGSLDASTELRNSKTVCCLCCKSGPISFVVNIDQKGFVPGQIVKFIAEVNNQSRRQVPGMLISLIQKVTFRAEKKSKSYETEIISVQGPAVLPGETEVWKPEAPNNFRIPSVPASSLGLEEVYKLIDVEYMLKFMVKIEGRTTFNLTKKTPVIIGTIPLKKSFKDIIKVRTESETPHQEDTGPFVPTASNFAKYPDLPPIHFEDALENEFFLAPKYTRGLTEADGEKIQIDRIKKLAEDMRINHVPKYMVYG